MALAVGRKDYRLENNAVSDTSNWEWQIRYYALPTVIIDCISQVSPEKHNKYKYRYIRRDLFWGIDSCDYGGWEVLWYAVCKLEAQGSWWCESSPSPKVWESGEPRCKSQSDSEAPRTRNTDIQGQEKMDVSAQAESKFSLPLPYYSIPIPSGLTVAHLHWWESSALRSLLIQMLISSWNILMDTPRNNVFPAIWTFLSAVKLTHKINHDN